MTALLAVASSHTEPWAKACLTARQGSCTAKSSSCPELGQEGARKALKNFSVTFWGARVSSHEAAMVSPNTHGISSPGTWNRLIRTLTHHVGCEQTARDIAQSAYVIGRGLEEQTGEYLSVPRLFVIANYMALKSFRGRGRVASIDGVEEPTATDWSECLRTEALHEALSAELEALSPDERRIALGDRSLRRIAEEMALSYEAVRKRRSRILGKLRQNLVAVILGVVVFCAFAFHILRYQLAEHEGGAGPSTASDQQGDEPRKSSAPETTEVRCKPEEAANDEHVRAEPAPRRPSLAGNTPKDPENTPCSDCAAPMVPELRLDSHSDAKEHTMSIGSLPIGVAREILPSLEPGDAADGVVPGSSARQLGTAPPEKSRPSPAQKPDDTGEPSASTSQRQDQPEICRDCGARPPRRSEHMLEQQWCANCRPPRPGPHVGQDQEALPEPGGERDMDLQQLLEDLNCDAKGRPDLAATCDHVIRVVRQCPTMPLDDCESELWGLYDALDAVASACADEDCEMSAVLANVGDILIDLTGDDGIFDLLTGAER